MRLQPSHHVGNILSHAAARYGDRVALIDRGQNARQEISYRALHMGACQVARGLTERDVLPGDRVGLSAENSAEFIMTFFGILYAGASVVPIPILSSAQGARIRLEHASVKGILVDPKRLPLGTKAVGEPRTWPIIARPAACADPSDESAFGRVGPPASNDEALVLYTSGTVQNAKGVRIVHASLLAHTSALVHHTLRLSHDDRVLAALPLTHSFGLRMAMLAPLHAGATIVTLPRFEPQTVIEALQAEQITWLPAVPTMFTALASAITERTHDFPELGWCLSAGAPLTQATKDAGEAALGAEIRQGYGLTEATFSTIDAPHRMSSFHPGYVGPPVFGVQVCIVNDEGAQAAPNEHGEIRVRGPNVMREYLDAANATDAAFEGGWLRTGDIGYLDEEGGLTIVDRLKDLIIRGGHNVYPSEIEDVLARHAQVQEVAVIGRPDPYYGEEAVAVIVPIGEIALTDLSAFARQQLDRHKRPAEVAFIDTMPLGPSRKVLKRTLREMLADGRLSLQRLSCSD